MATNSSNNGSGSSSPLPSYFSAACHFSGLYAAFIWRSAWNKPCWRYF